MKGETRSRVGAELEERTLAFAVAILRFAETLPNTTATRVVTSQLLRSATAVCANYREANRAESKAYFVHKVAIVLKEAAETEYWLQLCIATPLGPITSAQKLCTECGELIAIFTAIRHKAAK